MKNLTQGEREFLNFLASKVSNGFLEVSLRELARELGISHPAILKKVKNLVVKGVVEYQKGHGRVPSRIIIKASWDADEVTKTADGYQNSDIRVTKTQEVSPPEGYQKADTEVTKTEGYQKLDTRVTKTSAAGGYQNRDTEVGRGSSAVTKNEGYQKEDTIAGSMVTKTLDTWGRSEGGSGKALHDEARRAVIRWLKMGGPPDAREIAEAADLPVSAVERALAEIQGLPEKLDTAVGITCASAERDDVSAEPGQTTPSSALDHMGDAESIKPGKHVADAEPPSEETSPVSPIRASFSQATTREALTSSRKKTARSEPAPRPEDTSGKTGELLPAAAAPTRPSPPAAIAKKEKVLEGAYNQDRLKTLIYHLKKLTESNGAAFKTELLHIYIMQRWGEKELNKDLITLEQEGIAEQVGDRRWRLRQDLLAGGKIFWAMKQKSVQEVSPR